MPSPFSVSMNSSRINWIRTTEIGFYCEDGGFYIDPRRSTRCAVISHAHADHYPKFMGKVFAHPATIDLATARYKNSAGKVKSAHEYYQPFHLGAIEITLIPAGHMLGSSQILMYHTILKQRILYSGDFALKSNPSCLPLSYPDVPIDLLICECTFGLKSQHLDPDKSLQKVLAATSLPLLMVAYPMGKAQRVSEMLHRLAPDLPVFVERTILPYHKIYESYGTPLGSYQAYQRKLAKSGQFAYLIPPRSLSGFSRDIKYYKVFASGWNKVNKFFYLQGQLDISDHSSGDEIRTYLDHIKPRQVWFWHGYPEELIQYCKESGIEATAV